MGRERSLATLSDSQRAVLIREIAITCGLDPMTATALELNGAVLDLASRARGYADNDSDQQ